MGADADEGGAVDAAHTWSRRGMQAADDTDGGGERERCC